MTDRLEAKLRTLSRDLDQLGLADSDAVRRRGDRRTRNQVVGSSLAVVAVVAVVIGTAGGLTGNREATQAPPANPTVTTTQEQQLRLADRPFLRVEDLGSFGGYDQAGPFIDADAPPEVLPEQCATRPGSWGSAELRATRYYQDGSEASIAEYVLRFGSAAEAEQAALKRAYSDLAAYCPTTVDPSEGTLTTRESEIVPGFAGAVRHSRYFVPEYASEPSYYEVATARRTNVVVVLEWLGSGNPAGDGEQDRVWTAERLQTALDRAVT